MSKVITGLTVPCHFFSTFSSVVVRSWEICLFFLWLLCFLAEGVGAVASSAVELCSRFFFPHCLVPSAQRQDLPACIIRQCAVALQEPFHSCESGSELRRRLMYLHAWCLLLIAVRIFPFIWVMFIAVIMRAMPYELSISFPSCCQLSHQSSATYPHY